MTQEEKDLLIKDLSARFEYQTKGLHRGQVRTIIAMGLGGCYQVDDYDYWFNLDNTSFKPYLRPMSSMTEEEFMNLTTVTELQYDQLELVDWDNNYKTLEFYLSEIPHYCVIKVFDWLNKYHFDYRNLIPNGLALEAPEGMYK